MFTIAPQPLNASLSIAAKRHCDRTSNNSSGSWTAIIISFEHETEGKLFHGTHQIGTVQSFTCAMEILRTCARHNKTICKDGRTYEIHSRQKRLIICSKSSNNRFTEPRSKSISNDTFHKLKIKDIDTDYLFSYNIEERSAENASGLISRSSFSLYKLVLNWRSSWRLKTSDAKPDKPTYSLSVTGKTWSNKLKLGNSFQKVHKKRNLFEVHRNRLSLSSQAQITVICWLPEIIQKYDEQYLQIPTQFFPAIAITAPPLYCSIDC